MIICSEMKAVVVTFLFLSLSGMNCSLLRIHFYVNKRVIWDEAQGYCRKHHDDLSTISTDDVKQLSSIPDVANDFLWVGLYENTSNPGEWIWSGGEKEPMDNWYPGEPNYAYEHCTVVHKNVFKLFNIRCSETLQFFCMEIFELTVVNEIKTWIEALDYCRQNGSDLVSITSQRLMEKLLDNSEIVQAASVWIGLRFLAGNWFWVSGKDLTYTAWSQEGELQCPPKNLQCAALDIQKKVWTPTNCEERHRFVCLKKTVK